MLCQEVWSCVVAGTEVLSIDITVIWGGLHRIRCSPVACTHQHMGLHHLLRIKQARQNQNKILLSGFSGMVLDPN